jgi:acyl carrier protein
MAALRLALQQGRPYLAIAALADESAVGSGMVADTALAPAAPGSRNGGFDAGQPAVSGAVSSGLAQRYQQAPPSLRRKLLLDFIVEQAACTIGLASEQKIDPGQPLHDIGLDSLMAVELRNLLGAACGQALPATLLFDYPTAEAVADYLQINVPALAPGAAESGRPVVKAALAPADDAGAAALAELTDAEAEALLLAELAALNGG